MLDSRTQLLARITWRASINALRRDKSTHRRLAGQVFGLGVLSVVIYMATRFVLNFAQRELGSVFQMLVFQGLVFFTFLGVLMIIRDAMDAIMKNAYQEPDIPLLISSPISPASLFAVKLSEVTASNMLGICVWLLPTWLVTAHYLDAPWFFYLALLPVLLLLLVNVVSSVGFAILLVARFLMSPRVLRVLKALGGLMGFAVGLAVALFFIVQDSQKETVLQTVIGAVAQMPQFRVDVWVTQVLLSMMPGIPSQFWPAGIYLLASTILIPTATLFLASKIYYPGWELAHSIETTPRKRATKQGRTPQGGFLRSARGAMVLKDLRALRYNPQYLMMSLLLTGIAFITIFMMASQGSGSADNPVFGDRLPALIFQVTIYGMILGFPLTTNAFRSEAESWWLLQSLPISPAGLFRLKLFLAATLTSIYVSVGIVLGMLLLHVPLLYWFPVILWAVLTTTSISAVNLATGALSWFAETKRGAPRNPVAKVMTTLTTLLLNGILLVGPFVLIAVVWEEGETLPWVGGWSAMAQRSITLAIVFAVLALALVGAYRVGRRSLYRLLTA